MLVVAICLFAPPANAQVVQEWETSNPISLSSPTLQSTTYLDDKSVGDTTTGITETGATIYLTGIYDLGISSPAAVAKIEVSGSLPGSGGGSWYVYYSDHGTTWTVAPVYPNWQPPHTQGEYPPLSHRYWAYAFDGSGSSNFTMNLTDFRLYDAKGNEIDQEPITSSAPSSLTATGTTSSIGLTWTAPGNTGLTYDVYRGTTSGGESPTPIATGLTSTSYTDTSVVQGIVYYYEVTAVLPSGRVGQIAMVTMIWNTRI